MAHFHVDAMAITRGTKGGAAGFANYLARADIARDDTLTFSRYLDREHAGEDLVASGFGHLPQWARDDAGQPSPVAFWQGVDQREYANGLLGRHYQFSLPRELSEAGRLDLAHDLVSTFFERYPHSWAVHCPTASDGQDNPHLHVLFSTRRDDTDKACDAPTWFKKGGEGVRKDGFWDTKAALQGVRHESAVLINAALEREGIALAVSALRLRDQGHQRRGVHYGAFASAKARAQTQYQQAHLRLRGVQAQEQAANVPAWRTQRRQTGLSDLRREAVVDRVRNRFWRHDTSPVRVAERAQSIARSSARLTQGATPTPIQARRIQTPALSLAAQLAALERQLQGREESRGGGVAVRLYDREDERAKAQERGMGW